jgi:hypothetical protein
MTIPTWALVAGGIAGVGAVAAAAGGGGVRVKQNHREIQRHPLQERCHLRI